MFLDHGDINGQTTALLRSGATLRQGVRPRPGQGCGIPGEVPPGAAGRLVGRDPRRSRDLAGGSRCGAVRARRYRPAGPTRRRSPPWSSLPRYAPPSPRPGASTWSTTPNAPSCSAPTATSRCARTWTRQPGRVAVRNPGQPQRGTGEHLSRLGAVPFFGRMILDCLHRTEIAMSCRSRPRLSLTQRSPRV